MEVDDQLMDDGESKSVCGARIVVLSQDSSLAWSTDGPDDRVTFAHASSGYEAAAEMLSAPARALIIDLRLLPGRHLQLLEVARDLEVEIFAVGSLPIGMTAEDLSGVRLIARKDLPAAVRALPPAPAEAGDPPPRGQPPEPVTPMQLVPAKGSADGRGESASPTTPEPDDTLALMELPEAIAQALAGSGRRAKGSAARRPAAREEESSHPPGDEQPAGAPVEDQGAPDGLLSQAELNALLGDER